LSDRPDELPDADRRMLDLLAVMEATETKCPALFGISEGGSMAVLFAASHPTRCSALVLFGSYANPVRGPDHPVGVESEALESMVDYLEPRWGDGVGLAAWAPSLTHDDAARRNWAQLQRSASSPRAFRQLITSYNLIDVRPALALVQAPTLVMHRAGDRLIPIELGEELAAGIDGARLVQFEGADHLLPTTNWEAIVAELSEFVTGEEPDIEPDRVLATVLFTDIVDSTRHVNRLGDQRWGAALDAHDDLAARQVDRHGGRIVKGTGDGILAVFDGPTRAIKAAVAITEQAPGIDLHVRSGLHTGEILTRGDDVAGVAVHVAARVAGEAAADEVLASRTTVDLVAGSALGFTGRGEHELKGLDGSWSLFAVSS
jgi:class 3 adenylate cyclase